MTDSPAVQAPLDPKEQPILDRVLHLRDALSLLKQDKSTYIKSHDVIALYNQVIDQVHLLNTIREDHGKPLEQNRGMSMPSVLSNHQHRVFSLLFRTTSRQRTRGLLSIDISLFLDHRT